MKRIVEHYINSIHNLYDNDGQHIAFQEGIKAFVESIPYCQNPYKSGSSWAMAWEDGYDNALIFSYSPSSIIL